MSPKVNQSGAPCDHSSVNKKRLWAVLILSGSYMIAELVGAYFSGSLTLLADTGHMAIDTAAVALGLFAIWIAHKPPTMHKTYGYYRAEILAAMLNGMALIGVAGFIMVHAWPRFFNPPVVHGKLMTLVAFGGLIINLISLVLTHGGSKSSLNMRGVWLHIIADTLGSVAALFAAFLIWQFEWYLADPILSVILAVLIVIGAGKLLLECVNVLLEGTPKHLNIQELKEEMKQTDGVNDVHDLHVWMLTNGVVALSAHIDIRSDCDNMRLLESLTNCLTEKHNIAHVTLQLEPPGFVHKKLSV